MTSSATARRPDTRRDALIEDIREQVSGFRAAARRYGYRHLLGQAISLTHIHVLTVVQMDGPLPVSELARVLGVSGASATGIVSRMEERGLVRRTRGAADRRVVTVELAPGGTAALDEIEGQSRDGFSKMLATLTVDELEQVRGGFSALQRARESISSSKPDPRT